MSNIFDEAEYNEFDLRNELTESMVEDKEAFTIDSEQNLQWFLESLDNRVTQINYYEGMKERKIARLQQIFKREMERINDQCTLDQLPHRKHIAFLLNKYGVQVRSFLPSVLAKRSKSKKYMNTQIGSEKTSEKLQIVDEDTLETWVLTQESPEYKLFETNVKIKHAELSKFYKDKKVVPEGMRSVPSREEFFIKVGGNNIMNVLGPEFVQQNFEHSPFEEVIVEQEPEIPDVGENEDPSGGDATPERSTVSPAIG